MPLQFYVERTFHCIFSVWMDVWMFVSQHIEWKSRFDVTEAYVGEIFVLQMYSDGEVELASF